MTKSTKLTKLGKNFILCIIIILALSDYMMIGPMSIINPWFTLIFQIPTLLFIWWICFLMYITESSIDFDVIEGEKVYGWKYMWIYLGFLKPCD
jgi:hypothetical protein